MRMILLIFGFGTMLYTSQTTHKINPEHIPRDTETHTTQRGRFTCPFEETEMEPEGVVVAIEGESGGVAWE